VAKNTPDEAAAFVRGMEIIKAWVAWEEAVAKGEERSGLAAAQAADDLAADKFNAIASKLVLTPAATIEGVIAKARAATDLQRRRFGGMPSQWTSGVGARRQHSFVEPREPPRRPHQYRRRRGFHRPDGRRFGRAELDKTAFIPDRLGDDAGIGPGKVSVSPRPPWIQPERVRSVLFRRDRRDKSFEL
jgi:hypothetical protein